MPNITFGPQIVKAIRPVTEKVFDVHLMIAPVDPYLEAFAEAGADLISIHVEAGPHAHRSLQAIRGLGKKAGIVLNPGTPVEAVAPLLDMVDLVLLMTVNPGFGGQAFIESVCSKVAAVKAMIGDRPIEIEVDGGGDAADRRRWSLRRAPMFWWRGPPPSRAGRKPMPETSPPSAMPPRRQASRQASRHGADASRWPQSQPRDGPPRQKARGNARYGDAGLTVFWWFVFFGLFAAGASYLRILQTGRVRQ